MRVDTNARRQGREAAPRPGRPGVPGGPRHAPAIGARARLELQTLQSFRTILIAARGHDAQLRRSAGIAGSQLWALAEIARSEGTSMNALAQRMALHQTTTSNLVNALVERRLARRLRDPGDQRAVRLHLTGDGRRILLRAPGPHAGLLIDGLRRLETGRLAQLKDSLQALMEAMRRTDTEAAAGPLLHE